MMVPKRSHEWFALVSKHSSDAMRLIDPHDRADNWTILDCNDAACRLYGLTKEELLRQSGSKLIADYHTHEQVLRNNEYIRQLLAEGNVQFEDIYRRSDGSVLHVERSASLMSIGDETLVLAV